MSDEWCTIESDPGVFTELMESLGVKGVEVDELWSLDDESLSALVDLPVYGLVFLFKWQPQQAASQQESDAPKPLTDVPEGLFFAKQVTTNACATQAILSVLLNHSSSITLGRTLTEFHSFTSSFPSDLRGEAIGASEEIRTAHNSFARNDSFLSEEKKRVATEHDDVFHFIAYVPVKGTVYELDGLQPGPIVVGEYGVDAANDASASSSPLEWLTVARTAIQKRMELYASTEIKFNLMAITQDRRIPIQKALAVESSPQLESELALQETKREGWKLENERRRHNYLPLCVAMLRALAASGSLPELTTQAKERVAAARRAKFTKE